MTEPGRRRSFPPLRVLSGPRERATGDTMQRVGRFIGYSVVLLLCAVALSALVWILVSLWRAIL